MKRRDAYLLLITTFILILVWVVISIFNAINNSTISGNLQTQILPIQPSFDQKTIDLLKNRKQIIPENTLQTADENASTAAVVLPTGQSIPSVTIAPSQSSTNSSLQQIP